MGNQVQRQQYQKMIRSGKFVLTKDQLAVLSAARFLRADTHNSKGFQILIGLGLMCFLPFSEECLILTPLGRKVLGQYDTYQKVEALSDYQTISGDRPFIPVVEYYIVFVPMEQLPKFIASSDPVIRGQALSMSRAYDYG